MSSSLLKPALMTRAGIAVTALPDVGADDVVDDVVNGVELEIALREDEVAMARAGWGVSGGRPVTADNL